MQPVKARQPLTCSAAPRVRGITLAIRRGDERAVSVRRHWLSSRVAFHKAAFPRDPVSPPRRLVLRIHHFAVERCVSFQPFLIATASHTTERGRRARHVSLIRRRRLFRARYGEDARNGSIAARSYRFSLFETASGQRAAAGQPIRRKRGKARTAFPALVTLFYERFVQRSDIPMQQGGPSQAQARRPLRAVRTG